MFSNHPLISTITEKMDYKGHSGASFGWTMRNMEHIAKHGWDAFAAEVAKNRKSKRDPELVDPVVEQAREDALTEKAFRALRELAGKHINCRCTAAGDRLKDWEMAKRRIEVDIPCPPEYIEQRRRERAEKGLFLWCDCSYAKPTPVSL